MNLQQLRWLFLMMIALAMPTAAQSNTIIAVQSDVTDVQTGTYYPVTVFVKDVEEVWQINAELEYDPNLVYVVGTISGSPFAPGDFFSGDPSIVIRNTVTAGHMTYTHSLVAPAESKSGSGVIATFQIYPLSAGTTQIRFTAADLTRVTYTQGEDGTRNLQSTENLPVLPALIELNITGETVPVPDEATPTPEPSPTSSTIGRGNSSEATEDAPLVNVTLAPETPVPLELIPEIEESNQGLPILPIAIVLVVIALGGGIGLFMMSRRR